MVTVENPTRSLFRRTSFWAALHDDIDLPIHYTDFQACAYGGHRPRWTRFAANFPEIAALCKQCDGQHGHLPWGLVYTASGTAFSTAMEAAYPRGLCDAIANIIADRLFSVGVVPVAHSFDGPDLSMNAQARAAAGHPLKASKLPLWVPEYKSMFTLDVPAHVQEPQSRHLVDASLAAALTTFSGERIPDHTIFLAATPLVSGELGSKSGTSIKDNEGRNENVDEIN